MIIGIIDSGINCEFLKDKTTIQSNIQFVYRCSDAKVFINTEYDASDLHGTLVLNTVEKYKNGVDNQYIICNVYDENGIAHIEAVLEALRYLSNTNVEIIVISLTVPPQYAKQCNEELHKLHGRGITIFASFSNEGKDSGLLYNDTVYGVDKLPTPAAKKWYYKYINGTVYADTRPELIPMGKDRYYLFHGTSKANALAAGLFSSMKKLKSTKKPKNVIEKIRFRAEDVCRSRIDVVYREIKESVSDYCEIEYDELNGDTKLSEIISNIEDVDYVLQHFAQKYQFNVDLSTLPVEMFDNLAGIESYIEYHTKVSTGEHISSFKYKFKRFSRKYRLYTVVKECARYLKYNILQIAVSLACSGVVFITPIIEQRIVDDGIGAGSIKVLAFWAGLLVANAILQKLVDAVNTIVSVRVSNKIEIDLRSRIVGKIASVKSDGFGTNDSGKIDNLIKNDLVEFNSIVSTSVLSIVVSLFELAFATIMMLHYNLLLGSIVFIIQIVSIFVVSGQFDRLEKSNTQLRDCYITQNRILNDIIINIRWIRLIGAKEYLLNQFRTAMQKKSRQLERASIVNLKISSFDNVISSVGSAIMYLLGGYLIIKGNMTMGMLIGFIQYSGKFASPVSGLISEVTSYRSNIAAISDVCDYLDETGARFVSDQSKINAVNVNCLEVSKLSFSYMDKKDVFDNADAVFSRDYINYVIGPSGAGKTTLAQLIVGGFLPQKGKLSINGKDINAIENLESLITYVPQKPVILNDTVYNNLTLGENIEEKELIRICKACCIHEEIMSLPMAYETQMGEAGTSFSGGELQRVALARALLRKEPILLLDECTSALDADTEIRIRNQIEEELRKRLSIIITHSESFIIQRDSYVFLVSDGRIKLKSCYR